MSFKLGNLNRTRLMDASQFPMWDANKIGDISIGNLSSLNNGDILSYNSISGEWEAVALPLGPSSSNILSVSIQAGPGEYSSITAAMADITDASFINRYVIRVAPGVYTEENITVKEYVSIVADNPQASIIQGNTNVPVFILQNNTAISQLTISSITGVASPLITTGDSNNIFIFDIVLRNNDRGIKIGPSNVNSNVYISQMKTFEIDNNILELDGTGSGELELIVSIFDFISSNGNTGIIAYGSNATLDLFSGDMKGSSGTAINIYDGAKCYISSMHIEDYITGISDTGGGAGPNIISSTINFDNVTTAIDITNTSTIGHIDGFVGLPNVDISADSTFFLSNNRNLIVNVDKKGGTFTTINDAITYINSLSPSPSINQQYLIDIGSGIYIESPFTIPEFVQLRGVDEQETIIQTNDNNSDFITTNINNAIRNMSIVGPTGSLYSTIVFSGGMAVSATQGTLYLENLQLRGAGYAIININSDGGISSCSMRRLDILSPFTFGILCDSTGILTGTLIDDINFNNNTAYVSPVSVIKFTGAGIIRNITRNCVITDEQNTGQITGIEIESGGSYTLKTNFFDKLVSALTIDNSAEIPNIRFNQSTILNPNTNSIIINNPNTTGDLNLITPNDTLSIVAGTTISVFTQSPTSGDIVVSGNINQGSGISTVTNISRGIQQSSPLGIISGGILTNTGLDIDISSGNGYLKTSIGNNLKYVEWNILSTTLSANSNIFVYIDEDSTLQTSGSTPNVQQNILIAFVRTAAADIDFIQDITDEAVHTTQLLDQASRVAFGPIYASGSIVSVGTTVRTFDVTSGTYYYGTHRYDPSGATPITMIGYYGTSSTVGTFSQLSTPFQYDNSGVLTNITGGSFAKHTLYVVNEGSNEKYIFVYAQTEYLTLPEAEDAPLATPQSFISGNVAQIAGIIVEGGQTTINSILDIRPVVGFRSSAAGTTPSDHQSLTNRNDPTAHTQYLLRAGDTMTGDIDMNTNNIVNATTYNGVDIESHASRHLPGGADALTTAAPVNIGSANSIGIAASFARSDHIHNHGVQTNPTFHAIATGVNNGFMSSVDKTKLDNSTSTPTANTLVEYDASLGLNGRNISVLSSGTNPNDQNHLVLYDSANGNTNNIKLRAPDDVTSTYTLTLPDTVGAIGQILENNGSGNLIWSTLSTQTFVIQRRTTTVQNLNQASPTLVTWDITDIIDASRYNIVSTTTIEVLTTGRYELYLNMVVTSTANNTNLIIKFRKNGVDLPGSARGLYIRNRGGVNETSCSFKTIVDLTANDVISITTQQEGGSGGTVTAISGESTWIIKTV